MLARAAVSAVFGALIHWAKASIVYWLVPFGAGAVLLDQLVLRLLEGAGGLPLETLLLTPSTAVGGFGAAFGLACLALRRRFVARAAALIVCDRARHDGLWAQVLRDDGSADALRAITLYRNPMRQPYIHIVRLLNRRHAAGVLTRLIKVKAHCGEPMNEAADALASAAAEADGAPMSGELHLDPCAVHFYLKHNAPVDWDSRVRKFLTRESARQAAAKLLEPRSRRDGTDVVPAITLAAIARPF